MGAWGTGSFENDAALDWLGELEGGGVDMVRNALDAVADADPEEYIDVDDASAALAAAEIVAAASGKGDDRVAKQKKLVAWIAAHREEVRAADVTVARRAVTRVIKSSELQELWDEGGADNEWRPLVDELLRRLAPAPRGAAPKPAPPKKPAAND
jgi:hypothetical protein